MSQDTNSVAFVADPQPMSALICLAYLSTATTPLDAEDLASLIDTSQRNNQRRSVTGMLCYYDGNFLQFLEGEAADVAATLEVIARDPRHRGVIEMYRAPISRRAFPDWSMALMRIEQLSGGQQEVLKSLRGFRWAPEGAAEHQEVLSGFLDAFRMWLR